MKADLDLVMLAAGLERRAPGIWFGRRQGEVSYPEQGNAACFAVEDRSFWFAHRNRCILSLVRRFPPDGVFLDIGGGNGYVAKGLMDAGITCILLEPGIDGALAAHARGVDPVICATLEEADLPQTSIAAAGMFDVLEHIEDDGAALRRVHALLRPGGRLFVTVPAHPVLYSAEDRGAGHFRRYAASGLARVLEASGFGVEFVSYMFSPLPPIIFLLRTLPSWFGSGGRTGPEQDAAEHSPDGMIARVVDRILISECARIAAARTLPFGGSCICVARKD